MKNFGLALLFIIATTQIQAGFKKKVLGVDIKFSKEIKTKGGLGQSLLGVKDGKFITYGVQGFYLYAIPIGIKAVYNVWDKNLNLIKKVKQQKKKGKIKLGADDYRRTHLINGSIIQLASVDIKRTTELHILKLNPDNFTISSNKKVYQLSKKLKDRDAYGSFVSRNKKYFAFIIYNARGRNTEMIFKVFNSDIEQVAEYKKSFPYMQREIHINNFNYYEDGTMFFVLNRNYRKKGEIKLTNETTLYKYNDEKGDLIPIDLKDTKHRVVSSDYAYGNGLVTISGFYEKDNKEKTSGVFTRVFKAKTMSIVNEEYQDLDFKFITEDFTEREKRRAKRKEKKGKDFNIYTYKVKDIISIDDGSLCMAERYRHYTTTYRSSNGTINTTDHYVYNEIVLFKFDKDGVIEWVKKVDKHQHTTNDGGRNASFYYKIKNNNIFMVYSERENKRKKDLAVFLTKLDMSSGRLRKEMAFSENQVDIMFIPSSNYVELDKNTTVFNGYKRKGLFPNYKKMTFATFEF